MNNVKVDRRLMSQSSILDTKGCGQEVVTRCFNRRFVPNEHGQGVTVSVLTFVFPKDRQVSEASHLGHFGCNAFWRLSLRKRLI